MVLKHFCHLEPEKFLRHVCCPLLPFCLLLLIYLIMPQCSPILIIRLSVISYNVVLMFAVGLVTLYSQIIRIEDFLGS